LVRHDVVLIIGSLRNNSRLHSLTLGFANIDRPNPEFFQKSFLPVDSAETLTKLVLHECGRVSNDILSENAMSVFRNLKELALDPFPEMFGDVLKHATFTLTTFMVEFVDCDFADMREVLAFESVREVKHLLISKTYEFKEVAETNNLIPFLVEQLQFLEILELGVELALPLQCPLFTSMRRLHSLRVLIPDQLRYDGETHDVVERPEISDESRLEIVNAAFLEAFAEVIRKPRISLETNPREIYVDVPR
jgi:hypothetical protein